MPGLTKSTIYQQLNDGNRFSSSTLAIVGELCGLEFGQIYRRFAAKLQSLKWLRADSTRRQDVSAIREY
jgi:hypothetical protein